MTCFRFASSSLHLLVFLPLDLHVCAQLLSPIQPFVTPWTVTRRLLCPRDSPGKNTGVGCHSLPQGNLPNPGIKPRSPTLQADSLLSEPPGRPLQSTNIKYYYCVPKSLGYQRCQMNPAWSQFQKNSQDHKEGGQDTKCCGSAREHHRSHGYYFSGESRKPFGKRGHWSALSTKTITLSINAQHFATT